MHRRRACQNAKGSLNKRRAVAPRGAALRAGYLRQLAAVHLFLDAVSATPASASERTSAQLVSRYRFFRGTFLPFLRASDSPIAMACLRLLTLPPLPPRP